MWHPPTFRSEECICGGRDNKSCPSCYGYFEQDPAPKGTFKKTVTARIDPTAESHLA